MSEERDVIQNLPEKARYCAHSNLGLLLSYKAVLCRGHEIHKGFDVSVDLEGDLQCLRSHVRMMMD